VRKKTHPLVRFDTSLIVSNNAVTSKGIPCFYGEKPRF